MPPYRQEFDPVGRMAVGRLVHEVRADSGEFHGVDYDSKPYW